MQQACPLVQDTPEEIPAPPHRLPLTAVCLVAVVMVALAPDGPGCPDPPESFESRLEMEFERGVFSPACRPQQVDEGCAAITGATDRFALYGASLWMTVDQRIEWQYAPRLAPHGVRSEPLHRGNFAFTFGSGKKPSCCE